MSTLTLEVPDSFAERWDSLTETERQRRAAAMIETMVSFDAEKPVTEAHLSHFPKEERLSQGRTLGDAILEALGPEFAPDFTRTGTSDTARAEDFSDMDINGKFRR